MTPTLEHISSTLARIPHLYAADDGRKPAAVALVLACAPQGLQLLLIQRAAEERDPWSGNLAFPGGKVEPGETMRQAAERETLEEAGIDLSTARPLGRLADIVGAHLPVRVACFAYCFEAGPPPVIPNHEVGDAFWVGLDELLDPARHIATEVRFRDGVHHVPAIRLARDNKPVLWGITYRLVMQIIKPHLAA